jgi:hypothetical protein
MLSDLARLMAPPRVIVGIAEQGAGHKAADTLEARVLRLIIGFASWPMSEEIGDISLIPIHNFGVCGLLHSKTSSRPSHASGRYDQLKTKSFSTIAPQKQSCRDFPSSPRRSNAKLAAVSFESNLIEMALVVATLFRRARRQCLRLDGPSCGQLGECRAIEACWRDASALLSTRKVGSRVAH